MNIEMFDAVLRAERTRRAAMGQLPDIKIFDSWRATDGDLVQVESALGTLLPELYKDFMRRYGSGQFLFIDLLPAVSPDDRTECLLDVNRSADFDGKFVAVAPVGTGDWWGFVSENGVCEDAVSFIDHEDGHIEPEAPDFLEFLARRGLRVGA